MSSTGSAEQKFQAMRDRYLALYGMDVDDLSVYDLVLDSATLSPAELTDRVVAEVHRRFG